MAKWIIAYVEWWNILWMDLQ